LSPTPDRRGLAAPLLALILVALAAYGHALLALPDGFVAGPDVALSHYAFKRYLVSRLAEPALPLWNPHTYAGHPFLAYPEMGLFYPGVLLFLALPLPAAFTTGVVVHVLLAGAGAALLAHRLTGSWAGGTVAGLVFAFGGYMSERIGAGHLTYYQSAALFPWLVLAADRALATGRFVHACGAGVVLALLVLASPPFNALYALVFLVGWYATARWRPMGAGRPAWRPVLQLAAIGGLGLLLAGVQLVPTLELAGQSDRSATSRQFATSLSYPPLHAVTLLVPDIEAPALLPGVTPSWEYAVYPGVAGLLLAGVALFRGRPRGTIASLGLIALASISLMLGEHTPLYSAWLALLPPLGLFRVPARAGLILELCLALLAAHGLCALAGEGPRRQRLGLVAALSAALGAALVAAAAVYTGSDWTPELRRAAGLGAAAGAAALGLVASPHRRLWSALVVGVVAGDLAGYTARHVELASAAEIERQTPLDRIYAATPGRVAAAHVNRGLVHGYEEINGYAPLVLGRYHRAVHALTGVAPDPLSRSHLEDALFVQPQPALVPLLDVGLTLTLDRRLYRHDDRPGRAWLVEEVIVEPDPERQLLRLRAGLDLARVAVVDRPPRVARGAEDPAVRADASASVAVLRSEPERIEIAVATPRDRLLVLSELAYPGWQAELDGRPVTILTANYVLRAVAVPAGRHRVVFRYRPASLALGASFSAAGLGIVLLAWLRGARRAAPGGPPVTP